MESSLFGATGGIRADGNEQMRDPLRFLVEFVTTDLATLTRGGWVDLEWNLGLYVNVRQHLGPIPLWFSPRDIYDYKGADPATKFRELQQVLRDVVSTYVAHAHDAEAARPTGPDIGWLTHGPTTQNIDVTTQIGQAGVPGSIQFIITAPVVWVAWVQAHLILGAADEDRVKTCARAECGRVFVRVRRQIYCSKKCNDIVSMRNRLADEDGRARHRESSRRTYEKKQRANVGKNVKIGRRPRKGR